MLHGILVFYVAAIVSRKPKSTFKISCAQNVPKSYFSPKNAHRKGFAEIPTKLYFSMAERVGFEPTVAHHHT